MKEDKDNSLLIAPDIVLDLLKEFYNEKKIKSKEQSKIIFINFSSNYFKKKLYHNNNNNNNSLGCGRETPVSEVFPHYDSRVLTVFL